MKSTQFTSIPLGRTTDPGEDPISSGARLPRFDLAPAGRTAPEPRPLLARLRLLLVGLGSVGLEGLGHLARLGPAALFLVDPGRMGATSLATHPIDRAGIGRPKVRVAAERARALVPGTRVELFEGRLQDLAPSALPVVDVLVLATDNLAAEVAAGELALALGVPLVQASVLGSALVAQVRTFTGQGACPACAYGERERELLARETVLSCDGSGGAGKGERGPATHSPSFLCALAANLALTEVLALALGQAPADQILSYEGFRRRLVRSPLTRNPACGARHRRVERRRAPRALARCAPFELVRAAFPGAHAALALTLEGHLFVAPCSCGADAGRFVGAGVDTPPCPACGRPACPLDVFGAAPLDALAGCARGTLASLGAAQPRSVLVDAGERAVLFLNPEESQP